MARFFIILMLLPLFRTCSNELSPSSASQESAERAYIASIETEMVGFDVVRHNNDSDTHCTFGPVTLIGYSDGLKAPTSHRVLTLYDGDYFNEEIEVKPSSKRFLETFFDVHDLDSAVIEIEYSSTMQVAGDYELIDGFVRLRYHPHRGFAGDNLSGLPIYIYPDSQNRVLHIEMDSLLGY